MKTKDVETDVGSTDLASYILAVTEQLKRERKFAAAHGYVSVLHSFQDFAGGRGIPLPMDEVFTPMRLKAYEEWLMQTKKRPLKMNSVTSYMSSLRAVYNRWMPVGTPGHNPQLFAGVHTRVVSQTKRALRGWQMEKLLRAENDDLTREERRALAYFRLMFLCRGIPFIDLAHLRRQDLQGEYLVYLRHKTQKPMRVKLSPEALRLLRGLGQKTTPSSPYLLPILDAEIQDGWEQYLSYQIALRNFNRTLKQAVKRMLPGVPVSSYAAKHNAFAI